MMTTATQQQPAAVEISLLEVQRGQLRVDRQAGVIHGVKILGYESKNGRSYAREAVAKAKSMYEGKQVNIDHPPENNPKQPRKLADRFGHLKNVSEQTDGLYGDLHYIKSHALANQITEAAETMPHVLGLSHNSTGRVVNRGGKYLVEEIIGVRSVDLVGDPATNQSLFEGSGYMTMPMAPMSGEPADGKQGQTGQPGSADQQTKTAFRAAVIAALDDDSLDTAATLRRITQLLKSQEKIMGKPDESTPGAETKETPEGVQGGATGAAPTSTSQAPAAGIAELQEQVRQLQAKDEARELLDTADIKPTAILLESLVALPTKEKRQALVDSLKGTVAPAGGGKKPEPRSAKPLMEGIGSGGGSTEKIPQFKTATERAAFLRNGRLPAAAG